MQGSAVQCTTPTALSPEPPPPPPHPPTHQKQREAVCVGAAVGAVGRAVGAEQVVYKVVHSILGHAVRCDVEWRSWQSAEEAKWEQLVGGVWSEKCVGYVSVFSTSTAAAVAAAAGIPPSRHSPLARPPPPAPRRTAPHLVHAAVDKHALEAQALAAGGGVRPLSQADKQAVAIRCGRGRGRVSRGFESLQRSAGWEWQLLEREVVQVGPVPPCAAGRSVPPPPPPPSPSVLSLIPSAAAWLRTLALTPKLSRSLVAQTRSLADNRELKEWHVCRSDSRSSVLQLKGNREQGTRQGEGGIISFL